MSNRITLMKAINSKSESSVDIYMTYMPEKDFHIRETVNRKKLFIIVSKYFYSSWGGGGGRKSLNRKLLMKGKNYQLQTYKKIWDEALLASLSYIIPPQPYVLHFFPSCRGTVCHNNQGDNTKST